MVTSRRGRAQQSRAQPEPISTAGFTTLVMGQEVGCPDMKASFRMGAERQDEVQWDRGGDDDEEEEDVVVKLGVTGTTGSPAAT